MKTKMFVVTTESTLNSLWTVGAELLASALLTKAYYTEFSELNNLYLYQRVVLPIIGLK